MTARSKHLGIWGLVIVGLCCAVLFGRHYQAEQARAQSRAAFDPVKAAYVAKDYSASYRLWADGADKNSSDFTYVSRDDAVLIPAIEQVLKDLERVDPAHLSPCDARLAIIMSSDLNSRLKIFRDRAARKSGKARADIEEGAIISGVLSFRNPENYTLETVTKRLTGASLSPSQLLDIAEAELAAIALELALLEAALIEGGTAHSLETFAVRAEFRTQDTAVIRAQYDVANSMLAQGFEDQFYPYELPQPKTNVVEGRHPMRARGSYDPRENRVRLYHEGDGFDLKSLGFLAVHENWPGHHFESKVKSLPGVCPHEGADLFSFEAWATYAEYLADELGVFDDPALRLGWLDYRLIRAGRIVIDMRQLQDDLSKDALQALWIELLPARLHGEFDREYDRLFRPNRKHNWQRHRHLDYLLGYQTIITAKRQMQIEFGDDFDIRKFHHLMLTGSNAKVETLSESLSYGLRKGGEYPFNPEP